MAARRRTFLCTSRPDFHIPGDVDVGQGFDGDTYARRLAEGGADAVVFFGKCRYGHAYCDTRVGYPHPRSEMDMPAEVVRGCRAHDPDPVQKGIARAPGPQGAQVLPRPRNANAHSGPGLRGRGVRCASSGPARRVPALSATFDAFRPDTMRRASHWPGKPPNLIRTSLARGRETFQDRLDPGIIVHFA